MPLRTGGRGRTNGIYLLTNYVLSNRPILCGVDADLAGTWEFVCTNANYVLSGVVLTGNHLYYNQSVGPWPLPDMGHDDRSISQLPLTAAQSNTGT